jgi:dolichol-phosphate mannosyltransferase/undecaprenyl-phosphate 4-deoxy-4-formamido-L-arabinose transferase
VIADHAARDPRISGIQLMANAGQARATLCGLANARGRIVLTMDDDLQQFPEDAPVLVDALEADPAVDCVLGAFERRRHAGYRNLGSRLMTAVHRRAFGLPRDIRTSSFRAMRRATARAVVSHQTRNPVISALLFSCTRRVRNVPVRHAERKAGRSGYSLGRQVSLALDSICSHTVFPLRVISAMGAAIFLLSLVYTGVLLVRYFAGRIHVPGWTTVVGLLAVCSGLILLALGVIGEYLVRIVKEVGGAPHFVERQRCGFGGRARGGEPG